MRILSLAAVAVLFAAAPAAFALDNGAGVGSIGFTSKVTSSVNLSHKHYEGELGPTSANSGGRGIEAHPGVTTNPTSAVAKTTLDNVPQTIVGRGYSTVNSVAGRNDPAPVFSGKRLRETIGGLGM